MSKLASQKQARKGSIHAIIATIVVILVVGALGYVFWSQFMHKNTSSSNAPGVTTKNKTFTYNTLKLSFNYPSNWTVSDNPKELGGTVTSPDSSVTLHYGAVSGQIGGDCGLTADGDSYPVTSMSWSAVPAINDVIFRQDSTKYVSGSSTTYSYNFGLINDADKSFRNAKVGDFACNVDKMAASVLKTDTDSTGAQTFLSFYGSFKDLDSGADITQAQIDKDFASSTAKTAADILKSASLK